jgi:hypothetical protein
VPADLVARIEGPQPRGEAGGSLGHRRDGSQERSSDGRPGQRGCDGDESAGGAQDPCDLLEDSVPISVVEDVKQVRRRHDIEAVIFEGEAAGVGLYELPPG